MRTRRRRARPTWYGARVERVWRSTSPRELDYRVAQARLQQGAEVRRGRFYAGGPLAEIVYVNGLVAASRPLEPLPN
jgi:hypothetical protein